MLTFSQTSKNSEDNRYISPIVKGNDGPISEPLVEVPVIQQPPTQWSGIVGRKKTQRKVNKVNSVTNELLPATSNSGAIKKSRSAQARKPRGTSAVYIVQDKDCELSIPQILSEAKRNINLNDIGINSIKPRASLNGGMILEIGKGLEDKTEILAEKMNELFSGKAVKITCPKRTREILLTNLDISVNEDEIKEELKKVLENCQINEIGKVRQNAKGTGTVWLKCSEDTAHALIQRSTVMIGWSEARVLEIEKRPIQCYKCWKYGHTKNKCTEETDRQGWCYKCGSSEHSARQCSSQSPVCRLCEDANLPKEHRMGSRACSSLKQYEISKKNLKGLIPELPPGSTINKNKDNSGNSTRKRKESTLQSKSREVNKRAEDLSVLSSTKKKSSE
ncbi:uncharacterized protein LOC113463940 [Ceratina calcarata]|uniref:Uncharacterized protein LOC113463940 n=1 Tax=Ceratina calcarata TaxID=156304 RepID=A0AAJ7W951_9HYME|nr:uncharacterized protein LOC113463940 [Ceratina calcarata]